MGHVSVVWLGLGLRIYSVGLGSRVGPRFPIVLGLEVPRS